MYILIIEDDQTILDIFYQYLCDSSKNRICDKASTVIEAKNKILDKQYDVVFIDILMQGEMSTKLILLMRRKWGYVKPFICVFSALVEAQEIAHRHKCHFISKPFNLDDIDELLG